MHLEQDGRILKNFDDFIPRVLEGGQKMIDSKVRCCEYVIHDLLAPYEATSKHG